MRTLPKEPQSTCACSPDQGDDPPVDGAGGLGPQAPHEASDLDDRARVAALVDHLVDACGAQPGVLGQGVADERQVGVEGGGPTHAAPDTSRLVLDGGADRLTVEAELGRDGPELPVLAVIQAPDLGALRGRDHRSSFPARREAPASGSATGSTGRRPRIARPRERGRRQGRGVCRMAGVWGKCDPSRGAGRGRRAAGRGGRDVLRDCADDERWRLERTGDDRPSGTATCSRRGRGHTPRRRRRDGCTGDSFSGGGAGPRRRSARGDLRLDNEPEPWHNSRDRLGLSELGAVTRVRWANRALTPRLSPLPTLPERSAGGQRPGPWTPSFPMDAKSAPTGNLLCGVRDYAESVEGCALKYLAERGLCELTGFGKLGIVGMLCPA